MHVQVCNNFEKHLRGNVYVQFEEIRGAVAAYRALHCRWYGGRQLSLHFAQIHSWKIAVCGMYNYAAVATVGWVTALVTVNLNDSVLRKAFKTVVAGCYLI